MSPTERSTEPRLFGTFGGVFTPCTLTILGVIMFLRFGEIVGRSGILRAVAIVLLANVLTALTAFSLSAIASNTRVRGGGAYFMISRSLGLAPGGAIGLMFFLAQAVSAAMYIIGFTEAFLAVFPSIGLSFTVIASLINFLVLTSVIIGAGWTIKVQYVILSALALSLLSFVAGAIPDWSWSQMEQNLAPSFRPGVNVLTMFALFFPAVTGIMAGANMSGELRDPGNAIPKGTLWSIGITGLIYLVLVVLLGGMASSDALVEDSMLMQSRAALPVLVTVGIFAATLSSALSSMMGAPRVLQAIARDRIFPSLRSLAKTSGKNREPRRAALLVGIISQLAILIGSLDAIAPIITMFFLITYGMINMACFAEMRSRNPSFRPRFGLSHEGVPLVGALGCLGVMLVLNPLWATSTVLAMGIIYRYLQRADLEARWGDVNSGVAFERAKRALLQLEEERFHPKNWRPSVLAFVGNPAHRMYLAQIGLWLTDRGLLTLAHVHYSDVEEGPAEALAMEEEMSVTFREQGIAAFPAVIAAPTFSDGARQLIQCQGIGAIRPNTILLGWSDEIQEREHFGTTLRMVQALKRSIIVARQEENHPLMPPPPGPIDVWWRGRLHGPLMLLLAHLLRQNSAWHGKTIRLMRIVSHDAQVEEATRKLSRLIETARIPAEPTVVVTSNVGRAVRRESAKSAMVFMGFNPPEKGDEADFLDRTRRFVDGLPSVMLVSSAGDVQLDA